MIVSAWRGPAKSRTFESVVVRLTFNEIALPFALSTVRRSDERHRHHLRKCIDCTHVMRRRS